MDLEKRAKELHEWLYSLAESDNPEPLGKILQFAKEVEADTVRRCADLIREPCPYIEKPCGDCRHCFLTKAAIRILALLKNDK